MSRIVTIDIYFWSIPSSSLPSLASKYLVLPHFVLCLKVLCLLVLHWIVLSHLLFYWFGLLPLRPHIVWDFPVWSFSILSSLVFVLYHMALQAFCPPTVLDFLFWPFFILSITFLSFNTLSCLFFGLWLLSPLQVCPFSFRPSYNVENACTFDADDAWLHSLCFFFCCFCFCFCFVCVFFVLFLFFCIAAHIILLAQFNSFVINIHFVKLYDAIIFYYDSL